MRLKTKFRSKRVLSPLTPYVHLAPDGVDWLAASPEHLSPPLPPETPDKGYIVWVLQHRGSDIHFVSPQELQHAIDVLGEKILPSPRDLGKRYGDVNRHWLSRLHTSFKPWRMRQEMVAKLQAELDSLT